VTTSEQSAPFTCSKIHRHSAVLYTGLQNDLHKHFTMNVTANDQASASSAQAQSFQPTMSTQVTSDISPQTLQLTVEGVNAGDRSVEDIISTSPASGASCIADQVVEHAKLVLRHTNPLDSTETQIPTYELITLLVQGTEQPQYKLALLRGGIIVMEGPAAEDEGTALQGMWKEVSRKVAQVVPRAWETAATRDQDRDSSSARWMRE